MFVAFGTTSLQGSLFVPVQSLGRASALFYPWRPVHAPQGRRLSMVSQTWAALHGLFDNNAALAHKFAAVEVGSLAALVYPGAPLSAQQTIADFLGWVFLEDDIF